MLYVRVVVAAFLLAGLAACSVKKDAEQMKSSTEEIREYSRHLAKRTDDLEAQMANKESYAMLTANLDYLFGRSEDAEGGHDAGLNNEPDLLLFAGAAVQSMLFQFWKGDFAEDLADLDRRLELSAEILFTRLFKHVPRSFEVDVLVPNRSYKGVAALGAKLDETQPRFRQALRRAGLQPFTFYDLVIEALQQRGRLERRERFPRAIAKILQWKQEAQYLLQLRHNALPMMVVSRMTDVQDRGDLRRLLFVLSGQRLDLNRFDPEQLKLWSQWLRMASRTRADLTAAGIQPRYNHAFRAVVGAVNFGQQDVLKGSPATAIQQLQREFTQAYQQALQESLASPRADLAD